MNEKPPKPPNYVPEENLDLHENFSPAIAENGLIRPAPVEPDPETVGDFADLTYTRMDTVQDLVALRSAKEEQSQKPADEKKPQAGEKEPAPQPKEQTQQEQVPIQVRQPETPAQPSEKTLLLTQTKTALLPLLKKPISFKKFRRKKLKNKDEKLAQGPAAQEQKAASQPQKPGKKSGKSKDKQPKSNTPSRWPWVVAVLAFLFLGTITGVLPVEKIPLLRNLAYAMGFTQADTQRMSFLRALLTWTDKTLGFRGRLAEMPQGEDSLPRRGNFVQADSEAAVGNSLSANMTHYNGTTHLIDIKSLQALQRKQGRAQDSLNGVVAPIAGREEQDARNAPLRDDKVAVRTEAGRELGDVYFGSDAFAQNRQAQDGYDSSKKLASLKNPYITNGHPIDWMTEKASQLINTDMGIGGIQRELGGSRVVWQTGPIDIGQDAAHRSLYRAWITSRMSKYTPNLMLKKSLANSGFIGAQLPSMASSVLSAGGVRLDTAAAMADQQSWKEYLEYEKNCREELTAAGRAGKRIEAAEEAIKRMAGSKSTIASPTCLEVLNGGNSSEQLFSTFKSKNEKQLGELKANCQILNKAYDTLGEVCKMQATESVLCDSTMAENFDSQPWEQFYSNCKKNLNDAWDEYYTKNNCSNPQVKCITKDEFKETQWNGKSDTLANPGEKTVGAATKEFRTFLRATCKEKDESGQFCKTWTTDAQEVENVNQQAIDTIKGGLQTNSALFGSQTP